MQTVVPSLLHQSLLSRHNASLRLSFAPRRSGRTVDRYREAVPQNWELSMFFALNVIGSVNGPRCESKAPSLREHAHEVPTGVLSYDRIELDRLAASSAFGRIDT
jgi:hypothetical protein